MVIPDCNALNRTSHGDPTIQPVEGCLKMRSFPKGSLVVSIPQLWPLKLSIHHSSVYYIPEKFQNVLRNNILLYSICTQNTFPMISPCTKSPCVFFRFRTITASPDRNITASHGLANGRGRSGQSVFLLEQAIQKCWHGEYPLVNIQKAIENGH